MRDRERETEKWWTTMTEYKARYRGEKREIEAESDKDEDSER